VQRNGGFAQKVVVPWRALVKLPDNVDFETSAALTLAGSTAMHMLTDRIEIHQGAWVLVTAGASGVGSSAIQIARGLGARVISTASTDEKRDLARKLGAEFVLDSTKTDWPNEVRKITKKRGVDFVVEHIGGSVIEQALHCLARGGALVTCGATAGRQVQFSLWPFFVKQQRLLGSYGRNAADLAATLDWAATGRLKPVIDQFCSFENFSDALKRLRNRAVLGKILFKP
jgi:NADPH:quinone reductase-like Zn-dependent oxidoreductase